MIAKAVICGELVLAIEAPDDDDRDGTSRLMFGFEQM
jgi:hypothetical protein